jgi:hypothetical protein
VERLLVIGGLFVLAELCERKPLVYTGFRTPADPDEPFAPN